MRTPRTTSENEVLAAQRRACKEVTGGLEDEIDALHELSARKRACELAFFSLLYSIGAVFVFYSEITPVFTLTGIAFMGVALNSLAILLHDGLHGLLVINPRLNHLFSFLVGLPVMLSATAYHATHVNHHYELGRKLDYGTYSQHLKNPSLIWIAYFVQLFLGTIVYIVFIPYLAFRVASRRARVFIILEYAAIMVSYFFLFRMVPLNTLMMYWFYPIVLSIVLTNIRGVASHALGDTENIYLSSRTVTSSKWVSFLFLHENYHLEHHLFPSVPSYNLSKMHELVWSRLPEAIYSRSYAQFLLGLFKAAFRNDLSPMGIVRPIDKGRRSGSEAVEVTTVQGGTPIVK